MKKFLQAVVFLLILGICFSSCASLPFSQFSKQDGSLLKNWDTVNRGLEFYKKKSIDEVMADFGDDEYEAGENFYRFYSPSGESSVTFIVKKDKVKGYSYDGSYSDIQKYLEKIPSMKTAEIQSAADSWLGFSPDLLKSTFASLLLSSSAKNVIVGKSNDVCVEYTIGSITSSGNTTGAGEAKYYIKKAIVKGSYEELKDCLLPVPEGSLAIKKVSQKN